MNRGGGGSGRLLRTVGTTTVVLVLAAAVASFYLDLGARWFGLDEPSPVTEPAQVAPPPGLELPASRSAPPVARANPAGDVSPAAVRRALTGLVSDRDLGRRVVVAVSQLADGSSVYARGTGRVIPASTLKLVTSVAALDGLGPEHRFRTTVVAKPKARQVVLVGGGDPFLERAPAADQDVYPARADLKTLAEATARALKAKGRTAVRVGFDTSLFSGPSISPDWEPSYVPDNVVTPVTALWTHEGRKPSGAVLGEPAAEAAAQFARALGRASITVRGEPVRTRAREGSDELASVQSAPLAQVVQRTLEVSDNESAEVLFRHAAIAAGEPGSFVGGTTAVNDVLLRLGVDLAGARIVDGSGLSRANRLSAQALLDVIELAAGDQEQGLRRVVTGLPVAGFNGSLAYRFDTGADEGPGSVRAKTGTLTGVHGLAGLVTDQDGTELGFVAMADRVKLADTLDARAVLDEIASALAACSCGKPG